MKYLTLIAAFFPVLVSAETTSDSKRTGPECASPGQARINSVQLLWMCPANNCGVEESFTEFKETMDVMNHQAKEISVSTDWDGTSSTVQSTATCGLCALEQDIENRYGHQHLDCDTHGVQCGWISKACDFGGHRNLRRQLTPKPVEQIHLEELYCQRLIEKVKHHFEEDPDLNPTCQEIYSKSCTYACVAYFYGY